MDRARPRGKLSFGIREAHTHAFWPTSRLLLALVIGVLVFRGVSFEERSLQCREGQHVSFFSFLHPEEAPWYARKMCLFNASD